MNILRGCIHCVNNCATQSCSHPHLWTFVLRLPYTAEFEWLGTKIVKQLKAEPYKWIFEFLNGSSCQSLWSSIEFVGLYVAYQYHLVVFNARRHKNQYQGTTVKYVKFYFAYLDVSSFLAYLWIFLFWRAYYFKFWYYFTNVHFFMKILWKTQNFLVHNALW